MGVCFISSSSVDHFISRNLYHFLNQKKINVWASNINQIVPGTDNYSDVIKEKIDKASGCILLVSKDYMESEFIIEHELPKIFEKRAKDENYFVFPVLLEKGIDFSNYSKIDIVNMQYVNPPTNALKGLEMATADTVFESIYKVIENFSPQLIQKSNKIDKKKDRDLKKLIDTQLTQKSPKKVSKKKLDETLNHIEKQTKQYLRENELIKDNLIREYKLALRKTERSINLLDNTVAEWLNILKELEEAQEFKKYLNEELLQAKKIQSKNEHQKKFQRELQIGKNQTNRKIRNLKSNAVYTMSNLDKLFPKTEDEIKTLKTIQSHKLSESFFNESKFSRLEKRFIKFSQIYKERKEKLSIEKEEFCLGNKRSYKNRLDAEKEMSYIESEYNKKFNIYRCRDCNGWHFSTKK